NRSYPAARPLMDQRPRRLVEAAVRLNEPPQGDRIERGSALVYFYKQGQRTCLADRLRGGDKRVGHRDHRITRAHTGRQQCKSHSISAVRHRNALSHFAKVREVAFKLLDRRAADELRRVPAGANRCHQLFLEFQMGSGKVQKWNAPLSGLPSLLFLEDTHSAASSMGSSTKRKILAGFPATMAWSGTSRVTTLPAPTMAFSPIVRLGRIVAPEPIEAPLFTRVRSTFQSASVWRPPSSLVARG